MAATNIRGEKRGTIDGIEPICAAYGDIALDLLKFVATTANVGGKSSGSTTGFGIPSSAKPEDQVTHLLELYAKCRAAVESPLED